MSVPQLNDNDLAEFILEVEQQCSFAIMAYNTMLKYEREYEHGSKDWYDFFNLQAYVTGAPKCVRPRC